MSGSRESLRGPKKPTKTTIAESDQPNQKPVTERRSPKLQGDRRSPRGIVARSSDPSNQKKLGNRVADLESQLGQAQGELKILKHQLASTGSAKRGVRVPMKVKNPVALNEGSDESQPETDVFEVPVETVLINLSTTNKLVDLSPPNDEITSLKAEIDEKDTEMEISNRKKIAMKTKMDDLNLDMGLVMSKETETPSKMNQLFGEVEQSKSVEAELKSKLERLEAEKNAMETEMKMMRVQMEQWRKAAEAAAMVLSQEAGRGIESIVGGGSSPGLGLADDDMDDDGFAGGKKKGPGIRMFGEMWKRKGQK